MTETELQKFLIENYPKENEACEWKQFTEMKHSLWGHKITRILCLNYKMIK